MDTQLFNDDLRKELYQFGFNDLSIELLSDYIVCIIGINEIGIKYFTGKDAVFNISDDMWGIVNNSIELIESNKTNKKSLLIGNMEILKGQITIMGLLNSVPRYGDDCGVGDEEDVAIQMYLTYIKNRVCDIFKERKIKCTDEILNYICFEYGTESMYDCICAELIILEIIKRCKGERRLKIIK